MIKSYDAAPGLRSAYVFVLTLAVIAALSLILAGAWFVQRSLNQNILDLIEVSELEQDLRSASSAAIYMLLTEPIEGNELHVGGVLNPDILTGGLLTEGDRVSLRGAPYRVQINGRNVIVRIIAAPGLLPLDPSRPQFVRAVLQHLGENAPNASMLLARFLDYTDADNDRRINGAEDRDYPEGYSIANKPLQFASEVCSVLSWQETEFCADPRVLDLVFSADIGGPASPALMPDYILTYLRGNEGLRTPTTAFSRDRPILSYGDLSLPDWDALVSTESSGYVTADTRYIILAHDQEARLIFAQRVDLSPGSIRQPFERGFHHVIGGSWLSDELAIEGDITSIAQFPGALPTTD